MKTMIKAAALFLSAMPLAPALAAHGPVTSLTYETGPCFGACPVYRVTVNADGTGLFEGRRFTATSGAQRFRLTRRQYRAFLAYLAPVRPAHGEVRYQGRDMCPHMITDMPSASVVWHERRAEQTLYYYFGCDRERNRALAERLRQAPSLLPIGDYIGRRP